MSDAADVRDVISSYAHAVDDRDVDRIVACFTAQAHVEFDGGSQVVEGRETLRSFFGGALSQGTSTHVMSDVLVEVDGDRAHAETQAVAFHAHAGHEAVTIRGLRYSDDVVRTADGWRIARRVHRSLWECTAPGGIATNAR